MTKLTPCPYCLNGSSDPVICSSCGNNIAEAVNDENCVFKAPDVGILKISAHGLNSGERTEVIKIIKGYIVRSEEFEDMSALREQLGQINSDVNMWQLELKDYMFESLAETLSQKYGAENQFWEFSTK